MLNKIPEPKHQWTEHEKQVNCNICLLATNLKDCQKCPFFNAQTKTDTMSKLSSVSK